jgi:hypothetical protein
VDSIYKFIMSILIERIILPRSVIIITRREKAMKKSKKIESNEQVGVVYDQILFTIFPSDSS